MKRVTIWWMNDNHTFVKVAEDAGRMLIETRPAMVDQIVKCWKACRHGSLFARSETDVSLPGSVHGGNFQFGQETEFRDSVKTMISSWLDPMTKSKLDIDTILRAGEISSLKGNIENRIQILTRETFEEYKGAGLYTKLEDKIFAAYALLDEIDVLLEALRQREPGNK